MFKHRSSMTHGSYSVLLAASYYQPAREVKQSTGRNKAQEVKQYYGPWDPHKARVVVLMIVLCRLSLVILILVRRMVFYKCFFKILSFLTLPYNK